MMMILVMMMTMMMMMTKMMMMKVMMMIMMVMIMVMVMIEYTQQVRPVVWRPMSLDRREPLEEGDTHRIMDMDRPW